MNSNDAKTAEKISASVATAHDDFSAPWSLHFDRDGTEEVAVICDSDGDDLVYSRHFWLPEGGDPMPPTLAALRLMVAAPKLLAACRMVVDRWERGDLAEAARACGAAVAEAISGQEGGRP